MHAQQDNGERGGLLVWDTNTAAAVIVLGALAFLFLVRRGFKGVSVNVT